MNKELDAWVSRRPQLEASLKGLDNLAWRRGSAGPGGSPGNFTNSKIINLPSILTSTLLLELQGYKDITVCFFNSWLQTKCNVILDISFYAHSHLPVALVLLSMVVFSTIF